MRARQTLALTAALSLLFTGGALAASATDPVTLGASHVLDEADVLSASDEAAAEARLQQLSDETTVDLWVVYVDEFTNPADAEAWADQTATDNGLGANQYLLAVAVDSRQYFLSVRPVRAAHRGAARDDPPGRRSSPSSPRTTGRAPWTRRPTA